MPPDCHELGPVPPPEAGAPAGTADVHELLERQLEQARAADGSVANEVLLGLVAEAYRQADAAREDAEASAAAYRISQDELKSALAGKRAALRDSRAQLRLLHDRMAAAIDSTGYAVSIFDADKRLVYCNSQFVDLYRLPRHLGRKGTPYARILKARVAANTFIGDDPKTYVSNRLEAVEARDFYSAVNRINTGEMISIYHLRLPDGGWVATHKDVTEFTRLQDELAHRAYHDALTGLANRHQLQDRMTQAFEQSAGAESFALILIDLDGFKAINDTLGHAAGDHVLRHIAELIARTAGDEGMAARMGGDEFAVVMKVGASTPDAHQLAIRLVEASHAPIMVDGQTIRIGLSLGIAVAPSDGGNAEQLLKSADLALYTAKKERRSSYRFFESAMDKVLRDRRQLERDLTQALERGEFELYYQPILNLGTKTFSGFEALLRWRRDGVLVSPAEFIPVAEETGLIVHIGEWVLREAVAEAVNWPSGLRVAINVSSVQFQRGNIVSTVIDALGSSGLAPERVEIEITESLFLEDTAANLEVLRQLHAIGLRIALDDFGTGFSALGYLLSYPFDKIKIDGSFVRALDSAAGAHAIVRSIAEIGHRMGMTTTAEGVETAQQLKNVYAVGYTEVQGYLIARPLPAAQVRRLLGEGEDVMPVAPMAKAG
jgi:diguanylate cyclase (GGDEF)-like protein